MSSLTEIGATASSTLQTTNQGGAGAEQLVSSTQFLELLVAQIENQNPLEPLDGTEWATQLAEFANLEQLTQVNTGLGNIDAGLAYQISQQTMQMLGHAVTFEGDQVLLSEGESIDVTYALGGDVSDLRLKVYDRAGLPVGEILDAPGANGLNAYAWNGEVVKDGETTTLEPGMYRIEIEAENAEGESVRSTTYGSGKVTGISFQNNQPVLLLGDQPIQPGRVILVTD